MDGVKIERINAESPDGLAQFVIDGFFLENIAHKGYPYLGLVDMNQHVQLGEWENVIGHWHGQNLPGVADILSKIKENEESKIMSEIPAWPIDFENDERFLPGSTMDTVENYRNNI